MTIFLQTVDLLWVFAQDHVAIVAGILFLAGLWLPPARNVARKIWRKRDKL